MFLKTSWVCTGGVQDLSRPFKTTARTICPAMHSEKDVVRYPCRKDTDGAGKVLQNRPARGYCAPLSCLMPLKTAQSRLVLGKLVLPQVYLLPLVCSENVGESAVRMLDSVWCELFINGREGNPISCGTLSLVVLFVLIIFSAFS